MTDPTSGDGYPGRTYQLGDDPPTDGAGHDVVVVDSTEEWPTAPVYRCKNCGREAVGRGYGYPLCWGNDHNCPSDSPEDFEQVEPTSSGAPVIGTVCGHGWFQDLREHPLGGYHTCPTCGTEQAARFARVER